MVPLILCLGDVGNGYDEQYWCREWNLWWSVHSHQELVMVACCFGNGHQIPLAIIKVMAKVANCPLPQSEWSGPGLVVGLWCASRQWFRQRFCLSCKLRRHYFASRDIIMNVISLWG